MNKSLAFGATLSVFLWSMPFHLRATKTYQIDPMHTQVMWKINRFGFSNFTGKWMASGELEIDEEKLENSKANVTVNVEDMITGVKELDKHLRGKLFFEVDKFPKATFVSNKIEVSKNQITKVNGTLTIKDIAKPVSLEIIFNKKGINPVNERETVGYSAHAKIKRSDFGITTLLPGLGDEVTINIELEAYKPK